MLLRRPMKVDISGTQILLPPALSASLAWACWSITSAQINLRRLQLLQAQRWLGRLLQALQLTLQPLIVQTQDRQVFPAPSRSSCTNCHESALDPVPPNASRSAKILQQQLQASPLSGRWLTQKLLQLVGHLVQAHILFFKSQGEPAP